MVLNNWTYVLEPSTRTMHSFESAIHRSNGRIIKYETEKSSEKR